MRGHANVPAVKPVSVRIVPEPLARRILPSVVEPLLAAELVA